ncbi:MAG: hypothetical protein RL417_1528 [Pseudomonadota bacterium]|jgi:DNA-binding Lrp family transcriptional regulator
MRISSAAVDLVASVELHAHKPPGLVRAEVGNAKLDVEETIGALVRLGAVVKAPFLDPFRLGLTPYTVGFRILEEFAADKYVPLIVRAPQVAWLRRHRTVGEFSMGVVAGSLADVLELFDDLLIGFRHTVIRRYFLVVESYRFFGHKELSAAPIERIPLRASATHQVADLDEVDRRVVTACFPRRHFDVGSLMHELRMSASEIEARVERLRRLEIICGFTYRFEPDAVRRTRYAVMVRRGTTDLRLKRRFIEFCEEHRHVVGLSNFLGEWDHEVILDVRSESDLLDFLGEMRASFSGGIERVWWLEQAEELKASNIFAI